MPTTFTLLRELADQAGRNPNPKAALLAAELRESVRREAMRQILTYQGKVRLDIDLDQLRGRGA